MKMRLNYFFSIGLDVVAFISTSRGRYTTKVFKSMKAKSMVFFTTLAPPCDQVKEIAKMLFLNTNQVGNKLDAKLKKQVRWFGFFGLKFVSFLSFSQAQGLTERLFEPLHK
jgi:hypothetical protein